MDGVDSTLLQDVVEADGRSASPSSCTKAEHLGTNLSYRKTWLIQQVPENPDPFLAREVLPVLDSIWTTIMVRTQQAPHSRESTRNVPLGTRIPFPEASPGPSKGYPYNP